MTKPKPQDPTAPKKKPVNGRAKGARVERELCHLLTDRLKVYGIHVERMERNLQQSRGGGHDIDGLPRWAIECKSNQSMSARACWAQTVTQGLKANRLPVLFRKMPLKEWDAYLPMTLVMGLPDTDYSDPEKMVRMSIDAFVFFIQQRNLIV